MRREKGRVAAAAVSRKGRMRMLMSGRVRRELRGVMRRMVCGVSVREIVRVLGGF